MSDAMTDDPRRTAAERLREDAAAIERVWSGPNHHCSILAAERLAVGAACLAGADALDLVATQGAEIARLRTALEWQPIETAPRDGTYVLLRFAPSAFKDAEFPGVAVGRYYEDINWWWLTCGTASGSPSRKQQQPTGWMRLPAALTSPEGR